MVAWLVGASSQRQRSLLTGTTSDDDDDDYYITKLFIILDKKRSKNPFFLIYYDHWGLNSTCVSLFEDLKSLQIKENSTDIVYPRHHIIG